MLRSLVGSEMCIRDRFVYRPNEVKHNKSMVWYHHADAMLLFTSPENWHKTYSQLAVELGAVIFNPEVGIAPETKAEQLALNGYAALKHVVQNSGKYQIDPGAIAIGGFSYGGFTSTVVAMELAKRDEAGIIKLAFTDCGPLDSDMVTVPDAESNKLFPCGLCTKFKANHIGILKNFVADKTYPNSSTGGSKGEGGGAAKKRDTPAPSPSESGFPSDPSLFPAQMPDALLAKLPPFVIFTREFDIFRRGNENFGRRLVDQNRLLEFWIQPGCGQAQDDSKNHTEAARMTYLKAVLDQLVGGEDASWFKNDPKWFKGVAAPAEAEAPAVKNSTKV
eukprot:TRINITY_DN19229_c0_g1_i8.p1 TRINITY_DN19229_c0_g1~~TRINITY_DN19229_c0_g1_i8.p1  ORF type:complete len:349 (-),score=132.98 TRINITY_DN19229_c0_g1_i8:549-1550(-)